MIHLLRIFQTTSHNVGEAPKNQTTLLLYSYYTRRLQRDEEKEDTMRSLSDQYKYPTLPLQSPKPRKNKTSPSKPNNTPLSITEAHPRISSLQFLQCLLVNLTKQPIKQPSPKPQACSDYCFIAFRVRCPLEDNLPDFSALSNELTQYSIPTDEFFNPVPHNKQNNTPNLVSNDNQKKNDSPQALSKEKLRLSVTIADPISRPLTVSQKSKRKSKGKQMATRRSQRFEEKQPTPRSIPKYFNKVNS